MHTAEMLSLVLKYNREIMEAASKAMATSEVDTRPYWEAYQIYQDAEKAFETARRAAKYGFPGIED